MLSYDIQFVNQMNSWDDNKMISKITLPQVQIALTSAKPATNSNNNSSDNSNDNSNDSNDNSNDNKSRGYLLKITHNLELPIAKYDSNIIATINNFQIRDIKSPKHFSLYLDDKDGNKIIRNNINATWTKSSLNKKVSMRHKNVLDLFIDFYHHFNEYCY
jgi:hypothetical protein